MEHLKNLAKVSQWWLSRLAFTLIVNLVIAGCLWCVSLYEANSGRVVRVTGPDTPQMVCYLSYEEEMKK